MTDDIVTRLREAFDSDSIALKNIVLRIDALQKANDASGAINAKLMERVIELEAGLKDIAAWCKGGKDSG